MKNDQHQTSLQPAPTGLAEGTAQSESATVPTADGTQVPRYGITPYGGLPTSSAEGIQHNEEQ